MIVMRNKLNLVTISIPMLVIFAIFKVWRSSAITTRIPILGLDTNIPVKSHIDTALPIAGAMSLGFGAHVEMVAVFGAGGAFGDG